MKSTVIKVNFQTTSGTGGNKIDTGSLKSSFKKYLEDKNKIEIQTTDSISSNLKVDKKNFQEYMSNKNKMLDVVEDGKYFFNAQKNLNDFDEYVDILENQINENKYTANYYGYISFSPDMLDEMGIDRNNLNMEDLKFLKKLVNGTLDIYRKFHFNIEKKDFNHLSIFHNDRKHLHAHINFSGVPENYKAKIDPQIIARAHIWQQLEIIRKVHSSTLNKNRVKDSEFRVNDKQSKIQDKYESLVKNFKLNFPGTNKEGVEKYDFRFERLDPRDKERLVTEVAPFLIQEYYFESIEKVNNYYNQIELQYAAFKMDFKNPQDKENYSNEIKSYLDRIKSEELNKMQVIALNSFLKKIKLQSLKLPDAEKILGDDIHKIELLKIKGEETNKKQESQLANTQTEVKKILDKNVTDVESLEIIEEAKNKISEPPVIKVGSENKKQHPIILLKDGTYFYTFDAELGTSKDGEFEQRILRYFLEEFPQIPYQTSKDGLRIKIDMDFYEIENFLWQFTPRTRGEYGDYLVNYYYHKFVSINKHHLYNELSTAKKARNIYSKKIDFETGRVMYDSIFEKRVDQNDSFTEKQKFVYIAMYKKTSAYQKFSKRNSFFNDSGYRKRPVDLNILDAIKRKYANAIDLEQMNQHNR